MKKESEKKWSLETLGRSNGIPEQSFHFYTALDCHADGSLCKCLPPSKKLRRTCSFSAQIPFDWNTRRTFPWTVPGFDMDLLAISRGFTRRFGCLIEYWKIAGEFLIAGS